MPEINPNDLVDGVIDQHKKNEKKHTSTDPQKPPINDPTNPSIINKNLATSHSKKQVVVLLIALLCTSGFVYV